MADYFVPKLQSRPIKMRTPILYLANRWTKFKMLLTSNRFLYLIRFLLLSFPLIPQFIAQFRSICLFLCSSPYFLPVATKWELEQSMHCPICHCCHSFLFSPSERTKWRSKKVLKSLNLSDWGDLELQVINRKLFSLKNKLLLLK